MRVFAARPGQIVTRQELLSVMPDPGGPKCAICGHGRGDREANHHAEGHRFCGSVCETGYFPHVFKPVSGGES